MPDTTTIFELNGFDGKEITCPNCGWTGTGAGAIIVDLYGIGDARQVNCPNCDNNLGSLPKSDAPKGERPDELSNQIG